MWWARGVAPLDSHVLRAGEDGLAAEAEDDLHTQEIGERPLEHGGEWAIEIPTAVTLLVWPSS